MKVTNRTSLNHRWESMEGSALHRLFRRLSRWSPHCLPLHSGSRQTECHQVDGCCQRKIEGKVSCCSSSWPHQWRFQSWQPHPLSSWPVHGLRENHPWKMGETWKLHLWGPWALQLQKRKHLLHGYPWNRWATRNLELINESKFLFMLIFGATVKLTC